MEVIKRRLIARPKAADIQEHWPQLIEGMSFSTQEFYQRVEVALQSRQIPEIQVTRVDFKEGGALSARREYLRCRRERLHYDICAMPFGTAFFVSKWLWQKPQRMGLFAIIVGSSIISLVLIIATGPNNEVYLWMWRTFGRSWRLSVHEMTLILLALPIATTIAAVLWFGERFDGILIRLPFIGYMYERFFRRITYYRVDRTSAFRAAVHAALCEVIDDICKAQGIAPLSELAKRPTHQAFRPGASRSGRGMLKEFVG